MRPEPTIFRITVGPPRASGFRLPVGHAADRPETMLLNPLVDIHEGSEGLVLEADLPGVREAEITVELQDNILTLAAPVAPALDQPGRALHVEFSDGVYTRSFILSDDVDRERITASWTDGVLRLVLPRAERARPRRIEVRSSDREPRGSES
jgi:HSP20 family molecular chaperone IbpA